MSEHPAVTLAVLAGGESRRMGMPKAMLKLNGKPILSALHERLAWRGPTMLVIAPGRESPAGHELFDIGAVDPVAGEGPLRGVLTAMEQTVTPFLVIIPVDMPGVTTQMLMTMATSLARNDSCSLAMFGREGQDIEPLPAAFFVQAALPIVRQQLVKGCSALHDLPGVMSTLIVPVPDSWSQNLWVNLNRPEDVEEYLSDTQLQS